MKGLEDIRAELLELKPVLVEQYHVSEIGVFGSVAKGEETATSDVDILVEFAQPVSLFDLIELEEKLAAELGVDVDVVTKRSLRPTVEKRVAKHIIYV